jgi:hypothetical protein
MYADLTYHNRKGKQTELVIYYPFPNQFTIPSDEIKIECLLLELFGVNNQIEGIFIYRVFPLLQVTAMKVKNPIITFEMKMKTRKRLNLQSSKVSHIILTANCRN